MGKPEFSEKDIKEAVKRRYAGAIERPASSCCAPAPSRPVQIGTSCCGPSVTEAMKGGMAKVAGYGEEELGRLPSDAVQNAFGCGNPLAFAGVQPGQVVLDIGSGAGIDCLIAAEKVGPGGRVIGLDMTPEMLERARRNAREAGASNVEFRLGEAEKMPVEDGSVDWVISNCVINLIPDKQKAFTEIYRVLKTGGRFSISDMVTFGEIPLAVRDDMELWAGCISGALDRDKYLQIIRAAGFEDVEIKKTVIYDTIKGEEYGVGSITVEAHKR